jgi:hypothetical protein
MSFKDSGLSVNDYFLGNDLDLIGPFEKPKKPRLGHNPTVEEAREYAQKLEEYPKALEEWNSAIALIQAQIKARREEFYHYFFQETGIFPDHPKAKKFYNLCWEDGAIDGFQNVIDVGDYWSELLE